MRSRLAALIALGFLGCSAEDEPAAPLPPPPPGSITGEVLLFDGLDHSNTTVTMVAASRSGDTSTNLAFKTTTDARGAFEMKNVPPGTYVTTYAHDTYAEVTQPNIVVSDSANGRRTLDRAILTRASFVVDGRSITPGNRSPLADRQLFNVDGQLGIYDQGSGALGMFPRTLMVVGGAFTPDAKNALLWSGAQSLFGSSGALYAARIDASPFAAPVLVSTNVFDAGVSSNSQRAFVLTPSGSQDKGDLWTFAFADPTNVSKVSSGISLNQVDFAYDSAYPTGRVVGAVPYALPVYRQLSYKSNSHAVAGITVSDLGVFDVDTGGVTTLANVEKTIVVGPPAGSPPGAPLTRIIVAIPDAAAAERDVYVWTPGSAPPIKVNGAPLPAGMMIDVFSSAGRAFVVAPDSGGSSVSVFELSGTPNFRTVVPNLLWAPTGELAASLRKRGLSFAPNKYYALGRNGASADLVSVDLATFTSSVVMSNLTKVSGGLFDPTDDLTRPDVARPLAAGKLLVNVASTGTQLTPVLVDANGAHAVNGGPYPTATFASLAVSEAGTALAFMKSPTEAVLASIPTSGPAAASFISVPESEAFALSRSGRRIAFASAGKILTTGPAGDAPIVVGAASSKVRRLELLDSAIVAVSDTGSVHVGAEAPSSLMTLPSGGSVATAQSFADGTRIFVHVGSTAYELRMTGLVPSVEQAYAVASAGNVLMNSARTQAAILQSTGTLTLVTSNGAREPQDGAGWNPLAGAPTSPDGKKMYFRNGSGRIIAADPVAGVVQVANSAVTASLRPLRDGADFAFLEEGAAGRDVVVVNANAANRTVVMTNARGASGGTIGAQPDATLAPWISADGSTLFAAGDAGSSPGAPATVRLVAYTTSLTNLGDDLASAPAPKLDETGRNLIFQTNRDSLLGTATLRSYPLGGAASVVLAEKVRSYVFSPDRKALAVVSVQDGGLALSSGPVGQPATPMGKIGSTQFDSRRLFFSDDGLRLFAIDAPSSGAVDTSGILYTGAVGGNALRAVTTDVIGVFPDRSGKQAAVLTKNLGTAGSILNRFQAQ